MLSTRHCKCTALSNNLSYLLHVIDHTRKIREISLNCYIPNKENEVIKFFLICSFLSRKTLVCYGLFIFSGFIKNGLEMCTKCNCVNLFWSNICRLICICFGTDWVMIWLDNLSMTKQAINLFVTWFHELFNES